MMLYDVATGILGGLLGYTIAFWIHRWWRRRNRIQLPFARMLR
jgi:hypothetical protein